MPIDQRLMKNVQPDATLFPTERAKLQIRNSIGTTKPFRLAKYFSVSSFVVLLISTVLLSSFISRRARDMLLRKSSEYADLVVENLNEQVFYQFTLPTLITDGEIRLSREDQHARLDRVVTNTTQGFNIEKVEIYNANGVLTYSTQQEPLGTRVELGPPFAKALKGESSSELTGSDRSLLGFEWPGEQRALITYMPMWVEKPESWKRGKVLGVYVITQDVTADYEAIRKFQLIIVAGFLVFFGFLFATMMFIAKRAETILAARAEERQKLEEHLHQTERLAALGEMIAGVSHEIRNPLGIIRSTAELLQGRSENERQKKLCGIIVEESSRLNNIVTEFLDFARPKTPKAIPCQIEEIIHRNLAVLEPELEHSKIEVETHYQSGSSTMLADPDLLYRAMVNLLHNAIQAMPNGGRLTIRTSLVMPDSRSEPRVEVRIQDSGKGIPAHARNKIFNPFFTTREKGTGLGLAIVKSIIDSHGGMIRVESNGDQGTDVIIQLPMKPPDLPDHEPITVN